MIDLQASKGLSPFNLDEVGVRGVKYPVTVLDTEHGETQRVVAKWSLAVDLAAESRGTHMSRFMAALHETVQHAVDLDQVYQMTAMLLSRQGAARARVRCQFEWVRAVVAPVSKIVSLQCYQVGFYAQSGISPKKSLILTVLATSLCPCSKAISERGAHNQRSKFRVKLELDPKAKAPGLNRVIELLESAASAPVYPLLKRDDEKFVTELAYDNPGFVEDLSRNIASKLSTGIPVLKKGFVSVVNMESIHAHDCFAKLRFKGQG